MIMMIMCSKRLGINIISSLKIAIVFSIFFPLFFLRTLSRSNGWVQSFPHPKPSALFAFVLRVVKVLGFAHLLPTCANSKIIIIIKDKMAAGDYLFLPSLSRIGSAGRSVPMKCRVGRDRVKKAGGYRRIGRLLTWCARYKSNSFSVFPRRCHANFSPLSETWKLFDIHRLLFTCPYKVVYFVVRR